MSNVIRSVSEYLSYFEKENETYKSTITVVLVFIEDRQMQSGN